MVLGKPDGSTLHECMHGVLKVAMESPSAANRCQQVTFGSFPDELVVTPVQGSEAATVRIASTRNSFPIQKARTPEPTRGCWHGPLNYQAHWLHLEAALVAETALDTSPHVGYVTLSASMWAHRQQLSTYESTAVQGTSTKSEFRLLL